MSSPTITPPGVRLDTETTPINTTNHVGGGVSPSQPTPHTQCQVQPQLAGLSAWDPIYLGIDEYGQPVQPTFVNRCLLAGGLMGTGKSGLLSNIIGHISQTTDGRLIGLDGKLVELSMWAESLDMFVGPDITLANHVLRQVIKEMHRRYDTLGRARRRKIARGDNMDLIYVVIDEIAMFTAIYGTKEQREEFTSLLLELVALGRGAGIIVIAATQRPAAAVIEPRLRDLFSYRIAFRCSNPVSSNVILGDEWDNQGYDASKLDLDTPGVGYFLEEKAKPFRFRSAWLEDDEIDHLVARSLNIRHHTNGTTP